jgi:hypothetical protein
MRPRVRCRRSLMHALVRPWRRGVLLQVRLVLIWPRQNPEQLLKRSEILTFNGRVERSLHNVVARNEGRVHRPHGDATGLRLPRLLDQAPAPADGPGIIGAGVREGAINLAACRLVGAGQGG